MANSRLLILTILTTLVRYISSQSSANANFIEPDSWKAGRTVLDRPAYQIGTTLNVEWITTANEYKIILCHITNTSSYAYQRGETIYTKWSTDTEKDGFPWIVDEQGFDLTKSNGFFLAFQPVNGTAEITDSAYSQYFNLTRDDVTSSTPIPTSTFSSLISGVPNSSAQGTSLTSITTAPAPGPSTVVASGPSSSGSDSSTSTGAANASSSKSDGGLSSGATIGIGVGAGLGGALLMILAYIGFRRYRKGKKAAVAAVAAGGDGPAYKQNNEKPPMGHYANQNGAPTSPPASETAPLYQSYQSYQQHEPAEMAAPYHDANSPKPAFQNQQAPVELPGHR